MATKIGDVDINKVSSQQVAEALAKAGLGTVKDGVFTGSGGSVKVSPVANPYKPITTETPFVSTVDTSKVDTSKINNVKDANIYINSSQNEDYKSALAVSEPPIKSTLEDAISTVTKSLTANLPAKPTTPNLVTTYNTLKSDAGVTALETNLADLQNQARLIQDQFKVQVDAETGKPVAMNVIEGRLSEEQKQANQKLSAINTSISNIQNQLTTKYSTIDSIMKYTNEDYSNAVDSYDKQFANNLSIINMAKGIVDTEQTQVEQEKDDARANAQIILNAITSSGQTYDDISNTEKTNLTKLGVQSGLGANFFSTVLAVSVGKDILTTITNDDKTQATIVYKDGTTKMVSTGFSGGTGTEKLSILDVTRYNELYPEAGVTAGDSESQANAKVNSLNTPQAIIRALIISAKDADNSYQDVLSSIDEDETIKDKETAKKIAQEVYNVSQETQKQTQRQMQLESEITTLKGYYANSNLPKSVNVDDLIKNQLKSKGYSNQEIINSSLGSFVDKTITSISNFLFK